MGRHGGDASAGGMLAAVRGSTWRQGGVILNEKTQHGYLLLADISGYTSYLAQTELEHAQDVLTDLLQLIVDRVCPALTLAKLEGDAVFAYAPESRVSRGESLLELVEATYVAFRDRVLAITRRTTCACNACKAIPNLDLKFIVHHGDYMTQRVATITELVGSDVNLIHRLLKNGVTEATGWRAYALFTEDCLEHMCVPPKGMRQLGERYEHLGEIRTYSLDLHARYMELTDERRVVVAPEDSDLIIVRDFSGPPPLVWDWLNDPLKRTQYFHGTRWTLEPGAKGRTEIGARNHCAHGKNSVSIETILDWRPFEYCAFEMRPVRMLRITITSRIQPCEEGTCMTCYARLESRLPKPVRRLILSKLLGPDLTKGWSKMNELLRDQVEALPEPTPLTVVGSAG
jgi:hypothetical protein